MRLRLRIRRYPKFLWYLKVAPPSVWVALATFGIVFLPLVTVALKGPDALANIFLVAWSLRLQVRRARVKSTSSWTPWVPAGAEKRRRL